MSNRSRSVSTSGTKSRNRSEHQTVRTPRRSTSCKSTTRSSRQDLIPGTDPRAPRSVSSRSLPDLSKATGKTARGKSVDAPRVSIHLPVGFLEDADNRREKTPYKFIKKGAEVMVHWSDDWFLGEIIAKSQINKMALIRYVGWRTEERVPYDRLARASSRMKQEAEAIRNEWCQTKVRPSARVKEPRKYVRKTVNADSSEVPGNRSFIKQNAVLLCSWKAHFYPVKILEVNVGDREARVRYEGWKETELVGFARLKNPSKDELRDARELVAEWARSKIEPSADGVKKVKLLCQSLHTVRVWCVWDMVVVRTFVFVLFG